jgi:tetratricopeptide (TPR) repeat protein
LGVANGTGAWGEDRRRGKKRYTGGNADLQMQQVPESLKRVLKEAKELLEDGSQESSHEARDLLLDNPDANDIPLYHLMLARSAKQCGELSTSYMHLEKALELDPENITALLILAEARLKQNEKSEAWKLLQRGIELTGVEVEQKIKLGQLLVKADKAAEAVEYLKIARKSSPNVSALRKSYTYALKLSGDDHNYEIESGQSIEAQDLKSSIEERVKLAEHYLQRMAYDKTLSTLSPLQSILTSVEEKGVGDNILAALAHCHIKFGNKERAREVLAGLTRNDTIASNYVWSELQLAEGDVENAYVSACAVRECARNIVETIEKKAKQVIESDTGARSAEARKSALERINGSRLGELRYISDYNLGKEVESIRRFLDESEKTVMTKAN